MTAPLIIWSGGILVAFASAAAMLLLARHDHIHGHVDQAETELMITVVIFALGLVWAGLGWLPILAITRGA